MLIAAVANRCYHEHYQLLPMRHEIDRGNDLGRVQATYEYAWRFRDRWNTVKVSASRTPHRPRPGSEEEFVVDHWFAYTMQPDGSCVERQVAHIPWMIRDVNYESLQFRCDVARLYGPQFADALSQTPSTAFVSNGSPVGVFRGRRVN